MAQWDKITSSGNVEDRRGMRSMGAIGGGLGLTGVVLTLLFTYLSGGDVASEALNQLQNIQVGTNQTYTTKDFEGADSYEVFSSKVLGSTNDMWAEVFAENNASYREPKLVLFRDATESRCGGAVSRVGPHYCPLDRTIYLDETFFEELTNRLGAQGGDVAQAYVIAHEVGHHVQNELGTLDESNSNQASIETELQADCYAGLWAYSIKDLGVLEPGEIKEAMDAAAAVGDDRIQANTTGRITPETWTHGSSQERVNAFTKGYQTGSLSACNG